MLTILILDSSGIRIPTVLMEKPNFYFQAAIRAIEVARENSIEKLWIQTDSMFVINCMTKWIEGLLISSVFRNFQLFSNAYSALAARLFVRVTNKDLWTIYKLCQANLARNSTHPSPSYIPKFCLVVVT